MDLGIIDLCALLWDWILPNRQRRVVSVISGTIVVSDVAQRTVISWDGGKP